MQVAQELKKYKKQNQNRMVYSNARVKSTELIAFTNQLSVMLDSGVVLSDALDAIAEQMNFSPFKSVVTDVAGNIRGGESFSVALSRYPKVFGTMFISMVRASEASGRMSEMLDVLSGYLQSDEQTKKQVKSAMIYPIIMLLMSIAATGSLMFFVLPKFTKIYDAKGAALPKLTQVLVSFSSILGDMEMMTMIITAIAALVVGIYYARQTETGRKIIDYSKVHTPVFGNMFVDMIMTRSMRIMSTMVNTGVSLLDAIEVIKLSTGNYYFDRLWSSVDVKIRDGYQLSEAIMIAPNSDLVAPGIIQMLRAGEKSGNLGQVCEKISIFYEKKLESSIKTATTMIEPIMIIIMGGIIGTIAIALLLPVFRISSVMAH